MYTWTDTAGNDVSCSMEVKIVAWILSVDCDGAWSDYSNCNATCQKYGVETSTFTKTVDPVGSGQACPASPLHRTCAKDGSLCVTVSNVKHLDLNISLSTSQPSNVPDFTTKFIQDVSGATGISPSRIVNVTVGPDPEIANQIVVKFIILDKSAVPQLETDTRSLEQIRTNITAQVQSPTSSLKNGQVTKDVIPDSLQGGVVAPLPVDKKTDCVGDILSFNFGECWWIYAAIGGGILLLIILPLLCLLIRCCRRRKSTSDTLWGLDQNREKHEEYEIDFAGDATEHQALPEIELNSPADKQFDNDENFVIE